MAELESLVTVLKAAGEGTRLRLLALLAEGERSVKDLTEILGQSQPRVSRHLKLLADAGLVVRHAEGAWGYYGLADPEDTGGLALALVEQLDAADPFLERDRARLAKVLEAQQSQAAQYFAKVAPSWDAQRSLHVPDAAVEAAIVAALASRKVDLLLDLGTGTGRMLELLAPYYRRGIGIDSSREMIAVARAKLAGAGIAHAQVRLGDIAGLEPVAGGVDTVIIHQVLHYFDDPGRLLQGIRPVLKPNGDMLVVDFAPHDHEFLRTHHAHRRLGLSPQQMAQWARGIGMSVASLESFPNAEDSAGLTVCLWHLVADAN